MANLYTLSREVEMLYVDLLNSVNEETGEVDVDLTNILAVKDEEFNQKAIAVATVQRRFDSDVSEIDAEIKRLQAMKERARGVSERLKNSLSEACQRLGKDKIDGVSAKISFRKSEKVVAYNEEEIPEEYFNVTMTKKPDLKRIKDAIKNGVEIAGARIDVCNNIQIK